MEKDVLQKRIDDNILISVLIPVYNAEKYLRETLGSVTSQGLSSIEIIAVDNCSTDGSLAILRKIAETEPRLRVIALPENGGVRASRGAALEAARGKYVYFMDADDLLEPDILKQAFSAAEAGNCDVLQFGHREFRDGETEAFRTSFPDPQCVGADIRANPDILRLQSKYIWDKLFRHQMLIDNDIHIPVYNYMEDHYFLFSVAMKAKNFGILPVCGYRYRRMVANARTRSYTDELLDCSKAYWDIVETTRKAGLFKELAGSIWQNAAECYKWRTLGFANYDNRVLKAQIVKDWFDFFEANYPSWQKDLHLAGIPCVLPPGQPKKVLLLGGTGALGAHLRDILAEQGFEVWVTSRSAHVDSAHIHYLRMDAMNYNAFMKLTASHWDAIVDFMIYPPKTFEARLPVFLKATDQYVSLSSSRVYADAGETPITEESPRLLDTVKDAEYLKTNEYALAKARDENLLREKGTEKNWTIIRPYVTFSEERLQLGTLEKEDWLKPALEDRPIVFSEDVAERTTTLTYGRDVARGMAALIGRKEALGETFHITTSRTLRWSQVLDIYVRVLTEVLGQKPNVILTKTSLQLETSGKYQVKYDRAFNRHFDNSKIARFIDVSTFQDPESALESCLRAFLKSERKFRPGKEQLGALHDQVCGGGARGGRIGKYTAERSVQIFIQALKAHGISRVIASPGTTNLTFVASIQQDPFFRIWSAPDERSAAYMACGLAAESGAPVVITCTGATASRNYLPGLTEAYYRKLPVLAVTGTLDVRRSGHLTAQFVDRSNVMPDAVRHSVTIRTSHTKDDEWQATVQSQTAILELTRHGGGPVHVNLETAHSLDYSVEVLPPIRVLRRFTSRDDLPAIPSGKVAVWVGAHVPWSAELTAAVDAFCEKYDAPVFCDHASNYRGKYEANYSLACYQQSKSFAQYRPDVVIHLGEVSGDYPSMKIVGMAQVWRVSPDGEIRDTFRRLFNTFEMDEAAFFDRYAKRDRARKTGYRASVLKHQAELAAATPTDLPFSNVWAASQGARLLPQGAYLHFGILHTFRSWAFFPIPKSVLCSCNTGGFGIDGCLSTALGASLAHPDRIHYVALGDLAFFYDLNSLGNRHVGKNLRVLLVNNGKGVEFRNFSHPAYQFGDDADAFVAAAGHYGNKSANLVRHYAEDLGFEYLTASTKEEFAAVAKRFYSPRGGERPMLLEIFTTSENDSLAYEKMTLIEGAAPAPAAAPVVAAAKSGGATPLRKAPAFVRAKAKNRKIAVLTFHNAFNCGAQLQAWAVQTVLRKLGYDPEFPDCNVIGFKSRFDPFETANCKSLTKVQKVVRHLMSFGPEDRKRLYFRRFMRRYLKVIPMKSEDVAWRYGSVLVGSDQVWNSGITRKNSSYFLTTFFKSPALRRYSYAISFGDARPVDARIPVLKNAARLFENFSVREDLVHELTDRFGRKPVVDPDPTLLLTKEDFNRIACPKRLVKGKYLLVYSLFYVESTWTAAKEMAKRLGLKPVFALMYQYGRYRIEDGENLDYTVSPDRFLAYFRDAEAVVTSSFHGTAFSLIYRKPFVVLRNYRNEVPNRSVSLLKKLGEQVHAVDDPADYASIGRALTVPPRQETADMLKKLSAQTLDRLRQTLPDISALPMPKAVRHSKLAFPFRKIVGGVKCLHDNGVSYTIKHACGKVLRRIGFRSSL